jgi:hypothetical protein
MTHRLISLAKLHAAKRKPGYIEAVMAVAEPVSETQIRVTNEDFDLLRSEYALPDSPTSGPGTELKALLATIGIVASPTCKCNKMARQMDSWGPDDSLDHMEEIVDVMEETAKARKLPFLRAGARQMVRLACWKARRKARQGH